MLIWLYNVQWEPNASTGTHIEKAMINESQMRALQTPHIILGARALLLEVMEL